MYVSHVHVYHENHVSKRTLHQENRHRYLIRFSSRVEYKSLSSNLVPRLKVLVNAQNKLGSEFIECEKELSAELEIMQETS